MARIDSKYLKCDCGSILYEKKSMSTIDKITGEPSIYEYRYVCTKCNKISKVIKERS